MKDIKYILEKLCDINSAVSKEEAIMKEIVGLLPSGCIYKKDGIGNLVVNKKVNGSHINIMLTANISEQGLMAYKIEPCGSVKFKALGGVDIACLPGIRVTTSCGNLSGIIGMKKPVHLQTSEERKGCVNIEDLFVDFGFKSKEQAEQHITLGEIFSFSDKNLSFCHSNITSKFAANKACCAILIQLLRNSSKNFNAAFLVKENIGLNSAKTATYMLKPDIAIVLNPYVEPNKNLNDIILPISSRCMVYSERLLNIFYNTAKEKNIGIKKVVLNELIKTTKVIATSLGGVEVISVMLPCKQFGIFNVVEEGAVLGLYEAISSFIVNLVNSNKNV